MDKCSQLNKFYCIVKNVGADLCVCPNNDNTRSISGEQLGEQLGEHIGSSLHFLHARKNLTEHY